MSLGFRYLGPTLLGLCLVSCSASPSATVPNDASAPDAPRECGPPPGGVASDDARCVRSVEGRLADDRGAPVRDLTVTVCGLVCFAALSDTGGNFSVPVDAFLPEGGYAVTANGRPTFGGIYTRLPAGAEGTVRLAEPVVLPRFEAEAPLLPGDAVGGVVRAGPLTLDIPEGTTWDLELEDLTDPTEGRKLRVAQVRDESRRPAFAKGAAIVLALGPFKAKPSKPVPVTITTDALPKGTAVDFVVMTDDGLAAKNDAGLGRVVARGRVSDDGKTVRTDPGQGIDRLTWLAVVPSK
ncbi:MAG: hypothetical protein U0183_16865 [Polyangiaceae bacterium]